MEVLMRSEELLNPRERGARFGNQLSPQSSSGSTRRKLRSVQTAGGHHRIPASEIERFLPRTNEKDALAGRRGFRRISGRNQLSGRIVEVRYSGLLAQVKLSIRGANAFRQSSRRTRHAKCAWKRARPRQPSSNPPKL